MHGGQGFSGIRFVPGLTTGAIWVAGATSVGLVLGFIAKALQDSIDTPLFERIEAAGTNDWTDVLATVTKMGNPPQTQVLAGVLAVVLAGLFAWRGTRWWIPVFVLPTTWIVTRFAQRVLAKIVDRDQDVLALIGTPIGNYPSGGCARIIVITGAAVFLLVHYLRINRRLALGLFVGVAILGLVEAYCRTRLNQHWLTDVIGGVIFGWLMLAALIQTLRAFDPSPPDLRRART